MNTSTSQPTIDQQFADWLIQQRDVKNLSREDLSIKSGVSVRTIHRIENGEPVLPKTRKHLSNAIEATPLPPWAKSTPPESADHGIAADAAMN